MDTFQSAAHALAQIEADIASGCLIARQDLPERWARVELRQGERGAGPPPPAGARYVVSPYSGELSALFLRLRDGFAHVIDHSNKHEFYARLAHVANDWHTRADPSADVADLLRWVVQEARVMLQEIAQGEFDSFLIAAGDMVVADVVRQMERGEQLDEFALAAYLAHRQASRDRQSALGEGE